MASQDNMEEITSVPNQLYGYIIGKNRETIQKIEEESGSKIRIRSKNGSIQLRGTPEEREKAKHLINERMMEVGLLYNSTEWSELTFVKPVDIGHVIGKQHKTCLLYTSPSPRDS